MSEKTLDLILRLRSIPLTQTEISTLTGIPQPRLSRWENGAVPASADDALRLRAVVEELSKSAKKSRGRKHISVVR